MIREHNPYPIIIEHLVETARDRRGQMVSAEQVLTELRPAVRDLRYAYRDVTRLADYSDPTVMDAYTVAYFPYYIETLHEILDRIETPIAPDKETVVANFFGAGPVPELIGLASYLGMHMPGTKKLVARLFDRVGWDQTRLLTLKMVGEYWSGCCEIRPKVCDCFSCAECSDNACKQRLGLADLTVIQNCVSDACREGKSTAESLQAIFECISPGSLMIVSDFKYGSVLECIQALKKAAEDQGHKILYYVGNGGEEFCPRFPIPEIVSECLFTGHDGLIPKTHVDFCALAIRKRGAARH